MLLFIHIHFGKLHKNSRKCLFFNFLQSFFKLGYFCLTPMYCMVAPPLQKECPILCFLRSMGFVSMSLLLVRPFASWILLNSFKIISSGGISVIFVEIVNKYETFYPMGICNVERSFLHSEHRQILRIKIEKVYKTQNHYSIIIGPDVVAEAMVLNSHCWAFGHAS